MWDHSYPADEPNSSCAVCPRCFQFSHPRALQALRLVILLMLFNWRLLHIQAVPLLLIQPLSANNEQA
jgi:hypothetical protein